MEKSVARPRIHFMDEVRGFAVFCMIFYHAFYSLAFLFRLEWGMVLLKFFMPVEPLFAGLFIFISGVSSDLSRSNAKRGAKLLAVALLVTAVTVAADWLMPGSGMRIWFGILHFLACAMLLFALLQKPLRDVPTWAGVAACVLLYLCTSTIEQGTLCFFIELPRALYVNWLCPLGFYGRSFYSADYFPLLPWIFVFLAGTFFGRFAAAGKYPAWMAKSHVPFFSFLGRHALVIYIVHQPVIVALAELVSLLVGLF